MLQGGFWKGQRTAGCLFRATSHKSKRHLEKLALELEVLQQCPCGRNASIDEKVAAVNALRGCYSIHVLCDALSLPRGTYYNRKRRAGQRTSYEINDEKLKPLIRQIFHDSKNRFGRKPIHHKLAELGYKVSEKRIVRLMTVSYTHLTLPTKSGV